jgi:hypothetical protein
MNSLNFCYWLQGYVELSTNNKGLSPKQLDMVREHLKLVFKKETPDQDVLNVQLCSPQPLGNFADYYPTQNASVAHCSVGEVEVSG